MEDHEHPEVRRERRKAEAIAARGSAERLAQIAELEAARAAAKPKPRAKKTSGGKTPENSTEMFGHPWPEWFAMRDAARAHLVATAQAKQLTTYGEVWAAIEKDLGKELGNRHLALPRLLGFVTDLEETGSKMLPTSLIVTEGKQDEGPEPGFFRLAASLGEIDESESPAKGEDWTMSEAQREFWQKSVQAMYARSAGDLSA